MSDWQHQEFIPSKPIPESGAETDRPFCERGWTHWHHLFTPRQLLTHGPLAEISHTLATSNQIRVACLLGLGRMANWDCRHSASMFHKGNEKGDQAFNNQALNTLVSYSGRPIGKLEPTWTVFEAEFTHSTVAPRRLRSKMQETSMTAATCGSPTLRTPTQ